MVRLVGRLSREVMARLQFANGEGFRVQSPFPRSPRYALTFLTSSCGKSVFMRLAVRRD